MGNIYALCVPTVTRTGDPRGVAQSAQPVINA